MQVCACRFTLGGPSAVMQSTSVSQATSSSLLHTPSATSSPGSRSLQVPLVSYLQQSTAPSLPQVERAAHFVI
jgi:hypothetical protein